MKDETFTLAEAHIGIDGDARRRHRRLRGGGSGETRDELIGPAHRVGLGCGHIATSSFSLSLSLTPSDFAGCDGSEGRIWLESRDPRGETHGVPRCGGMVSVSRWKEIPRKRVSPTRPLF